MSLALARTLLLCLLGLGIRLAPRLWRSAAQVTQTSQKEGRSDRVLVQIVKVTQILSDLQHSWT